MRIKQKSIILFLSLILNSCAVQGNETIKPTAPVKTLLPSVQVSASSPNASPNPDEKYKGLEKYGQIEKFDRPDVYYKILYCEPESNKKPELRYPVKIAVSKDGNYVYTINGKCSRTPFLPRNFSSDEVCKNEEQKFHENLIERNSILKITKDKNIEIVKVNNEPLLSCTLNSEIEVDNEDSLFLADFQKNIYKLVAPNNLIKIVNVMQKANGCTNPVSINPVTRDCDIPFLDGPRNFYYSENNMYFKMVAYGESSEVHVKKLDKNGIVSEVNSGVVPFLSPFAIFKDKLFTIDMASLTEFVLPINTINLGKRISPLDAPSDLNIGPSNPNFVTSIKINLKGEIFINDLEKHSIWKVIPGENVKEMTKFAGSGKAGYKDGKGSEAEFNYPTEMSFDSHDNLYIADTGNNAIRKITPDGTVSTFYKQ